MHGEHKVRFIVVVVLEEFDVDHGKMSRLHASATPTQSHAPDRACEVTGSSINSSGVIWLGKESVCSFLARWRCEVCSCQQTTTRHNCEVGRWLLS
jgi:hypothetical protein